MRFRGRQMAHTSIGEDLLKRFAENCTEFASMDRMPKLEGRHMTMLLSPKVSKDPKKDAGQDSKKESAQEPKKDSPQK